MITSFVVRRAENGFFVALDRMVTVTREDERYNEYTHETFVFESPAKLSKALKLFVTDLKTNVDEPVPF